MYVTVASLNLFTLQAQDILLLVLGQYISYPKLPVSLCCAGEPLSKLANSFLMDQFFRGDRKLSSTKIIEPWQPAAGARPAFLCSKPFLTNSHSNISACQLCNAVLFSLYTKKLLAYASDRPNKKQRRNARAYYFLKRFSSN